MGRRDNLHLPPGLGVGVLLVRHGHVVLGRRKGDHGAGLWSCPGGWVDGGEGPDDPGETPQEAAARELEEETGLVVPVSACRPFCWAYTRFPDERTHSVTLYHAVRPRGEVVLTNMEPDKCEGWDWYPYGGPADRLPGPMWPSTRSACEQLAQRGES